MKPMRYVIIKHHKVKRRSSVVNPIHMAVSDRLMDAYKEGYRDGQLDWYLDNMGGKTSYHDGYEQGWQDGYNEAIGLGDER